jgi:hypothetical protein
MGVFPFCVYAIPSILQLEFQKATTPDERRSIKWLLRNVVVDEESTNMRWKNAN